MMNLFDIVIPTTQFDHNLEQLVQSLSVLQKKYSCQIWICLNPHQDYASNSVYKKINSLVQVVTTELGVNKARQAGLNQSRARFVLFLDSDCIFDNQKTVASWLEMLQSDPELLAVGGYYQADRMDMSWFQKQYFLMQNNWLHSGQLKNGFCLYLLGGYFILNRELALKNQIAFDQNIIFGGSEKEFFIQAYLKKQKIRLTTDAIVHRYDQSAWKYLQKTYKQGRGQAYIDQKHGEIDFSNVLLDPASIDAGQGILKWAFWWGYCSYLKNYSGFFKIIFQNNWGQISSVRYQIVKQIKKDLEKMP